MFTKEDYIEFINSKCFIIHEASINPSLNQCRELLVGVDELIDKRGGIGDMRSRQILLGDFGIITTVLGDTIEFIPEPSIKEHWRINKVITI